MHRGEVFNHLTSEQQISPPDDEFTALSDESSLIVRIWPFEIPNIENLLELGNLKMIYVTLALDKLPKLVWEPGRTERCIAVNVWAASRWVDLIDEIERRSSSPDIDPELLKVDGNS